MASDQGVGVDVVKVAALVRSVPPEAETVFDLAKMLDKDGTPRQVLEVRRRELQPEPLQPPVRRESPRRAHVFASLAGFGTYLERYGGENTVVLADIEKREVYAVLDERANKGFEVVVLRPILHPALAPWVKVLEGKPLPLEVFCDFLARNRRAVTRPDGKALALTLSQVRCSTQITLQRGRGAHSINGLKLTATIQGERQGEELVALPDVLTLQTPVFVDSSPRTLECDLTLSAMESGTVIVATLTSADLDAALVEEFEFLVASLSHTKGIVGLGRPVHGEWNYLD